MDSKLKILIGIAAFAILLTVAALLYNKLSKNESPPKVTPSAPMQSVKKAAPDFTASDIKGLDVSLSDFKGKPVVINFWASWCPPCKAEMPDYEKLYREYSSKGVVFMMVDLTDGSRETITTAKKFITDSKYTFPVYFDVKYSGANAYKINSIPVSVFVDKDGNISSSYNTKLDEATIRKSIEAIL